jgi:hypothetical protein
MRTQNTETEQQLKVLLREYANLLDGAKLAKIELTRKEREIADFLEDHPEAAGTAKLPKKFLPKDSEETVEVEE